MHANLMNYFNPNSVYTEEDFRRSFQMRCHVFERVLRDVQQVNSYFRQKRDRAGCPGFSPHQKVTVALRMMAYGSQLIRWMKPMVYKDEYLRVPNQKYLDRLIRKAEDCGFPGMIGYYLADDIYPKWATLVQAIPNLRNDVEKLFTLHRETNWKDVERAFGILQARWKIISEPAKRDERDGYIDEESDDDQENPNKSRRIRAKIYDGPNLPFNPRTA
ncbi:uncharacterized protein [Pyrus communis]|uniref:uncharacterized protein n=1 Tax=Pyrus communis TaxID=23211 RepID=UPI0035C05AA9